MFFVFAAIVLLATPSLAQIDCTGKEDGPHGIGCKSYTECTGGKGKTIECKTDEVFDSTIGKCNSIQSVTTPCGSTPECEGKNGRFAFASDCRYFITCDDGRFAGIQQCSKDLDENLVFDEVLQVCNWKSAVAQPCGTL